MPTTDTTIVTDSDSTDADGHETSSGARPVEVEVLVEEISIDGMCGVY